MILLIKLPHTHIPPSDAYSPRKRYSGVSARHLSAQEMALYLHFCVPHYVPQINFIITFVFVHTQTATLFGVNTKFTAHNKQDSALLCIQNDFE